MLVGSFPSLFATCFTAWQKPCEGSLKVHARVFTIGLISRDMNGRIFLLLLGTVFTIVRQRRKKNLYTCSATWDNHKFVYVHARINSNCNLQEFLLLKIPGDLEVGWFPWEQRRTNTSTSFFDLALRYSSVPTNGLPAVHLPQNKPCAQSSMA